MRLFLALLLAGIVALMPMSAVAGHSSTPADPQEMPCHSQDGSQPQDGAVSCADLQGCCGGYLTPAVLSTASPQAAEQCSTTRDKRHAGFVPDQLDPPPVL